MWQIGVGIVAVAAIVVVALLQGINGALAMTGLTVIGGLFGWVAKKQKDIKGIGKVQIPDFEPSFGNSVRAVGLVALPQRAKRTVLENKIDFDAIEGECRAEIKNRGWKFTWAKMYSIAHNRAVALKVDSMMEAIDGNFWLMRVAREAFREIIGDVPRDTLEGLEHQNDEYRKAKCRWLNISEKTVFSWYQRLIQHQEGLNDLLECGIDWQKVANPYKTVWMIGELAMNPRIDISKSE